MIGLGPHEMDARLWAFSVGLTVALTLLAVVSVFAAVRATRVQRPTTTRRHGYPASLLEAAAAAKRHRRGRSGS